VERAVSGAPLEGILVLDFSRVLAGPYCGRMLVDLGADVLKIEPPEGDMSRYGRPRRNSMAVYYAQQNCGKRNVSLDLKRPEALEILHGLAARADVVLENFRPGVMERMGLGYQELARANPRLIYAGISGYGQRGPWAHRRAYAPLIHAEMGLLEGFARYRGLDVGQEPFSHADLYAGLHCLAAILAALHQRAQTGRGQQIDVAMAEAMLCASEGGAAQLSGLRAEQPHRPLTVASPVFPTAEGHRITIGGEPALRGSFGAYCRAMRRPELAKDPRFVDDAARERNRGELLALIGEWVAGFDDLEALDHALAEVGLVMGVVRTIEEVGESDWAAERGAVVEVSDRSGGAFRLPNSPWRFSEGPSGVRGEPAYRGEHNREVLSELLDYDEERLDALEASGVLSSRLPR
jgi:CoA:oxalate CoA-transferase